MKPPVIAGAGMTRFTKQAERGYAGLSHEAILAALANADMMPADIGAVFCGCLGGRSGIGQSCVKDLGFAATPVINIENACASSSTALREAMAWIAAGYCDTALVFGVEILTVASGPLPLPRSNWMFDTGLNLPAWYALQATRYLEDHKARVEDLAAVSVKSRLLAQYNPRAHFQEPTTVEDVLASPMIAEPLTRNQCCPRTDGAAAVVVVSDEVARRRGLSGVKIRSSALSGGVPVFNDGTDHLPTALRVAREALERAGIAPDEIDVAEVHDAFTIGEVIYTEALGVFPEGEGAARIAAGETLPNQGRTAINPSGGLLSRGHPLGASGLAMICEIVWQLRGMSGRRQVDGARIGATHTMGATEFEWDTNVCAVFVLEAP